MAVNNYLKNVMKSVAYAAADVSGEYIPSIKEFNSSNKDFAKSTYAALKNPVYTVRRSVQAIQQSKVYKALDYGARNLSEDLRTGNFYNKARKDRDELSLSGLDTNWDDLSEFGIDSDWESKRDSQSSRNQEVTAGDMKIVESIEGSNAALANATVNAVITSSHNEIKNSRATAGMLYMQNEKLFGGLHKDITVLGSTMQQMYKLQDASLRNIDKNLSDFFTQESKLSQERNNILKEMLELQRNVYKSAADKEKETAGKRKSSSIRWSDISTNGMVNISEYFAAVKKNINNELSSIMPGGFGEDSNMLATFMTSPLEHLMKYVVNGVIPATVKAASKQLDGTVSGIFGNIIGELGNARSKNEGGLLGFISKFLGVSTSVKRDVDTSKYERGPIPFDGITRKAIIDVIPTHLRRIEAAITGRPEEMFDYKAGKWVKVSDVKKRFDDIKKSAIKRATSDIREAMNPGVQAVRNGINNVRDRDDWDKAIEEFEAFLYDNNGRFNSKVSASKNGINAANYPSLYRHYSKISTIFKDFDRIESKDSKGNKVIRNTKNSVRVGMSKAVLDAKGYEDRQYRDIESDVGNALQSIFSMNFKNIDSHGKYDEKDKNKFQAFNMLHTKDNLGNTIFDYLQNINKELIWFRLNGVPGGGGGNFIGPRTNPAGRVSMDEIHKQLNKNKSNDNYNRQVSNDDKAARSALNAISSGKAIDLRDFDRDQQAYLLQLSSMLSNGAIGEYKSEIEGYNSNAISGFIDKHIVKTNIKSLKDVSKAIEKADAEGKNTNEVNMDAKEEKFFNKILKKIGASGSIFGGIVGASAESFTNLLYTADKAIYEMMYKTEIFDNEDKKKKYKGFMDMMVGKVTDKFKQITDWFKEDILEPFKQRLGWDKDRFNNTLKDAGGKLWTAFKDANKSVYGPIIDKMRPEPDYEELENKRLEAEKEELKEERKRIKNLLKDLKNRHQSTSNMTNKDFSRAIESGTRDWDNDPMFVGMGRSNLAKDARKVRMSVIHEGGEALAIWCERNGFTGSLDDKKVRLGAEFGLPAAALAAIKTHEDANLVFAKQFRHHAKGTPSGRPFSGITTLTKGEGFISSRGMGVVPKTGVYNVSRPTHIINRKDMASLRGRKLSNASIQGDLGKEKLAAKRAGFNVAHHEAGTGSLEITNANGAKDLDASEIVKEAKKNIPEAAAGGLVGGILSTTLGLVGGPLLGAAIGAGAAIVKRSESLSEKILGKKGEDGKREGGILPKSIVNWLDKHFPSIKKYGLAGIIPGMLTSYGAIGGLLVGGAFGFLKSSSDSSKKYFGEEGILKIGTKEKQIIEKMLPGTLKGAGLGAALTFVLGGPFSLLGNATLGAGLGMISSTEDFKNLILGEEVNGQRIGGLVGALKNAIDPFTEALRSAGSKLSTAFEKNLFEPLGKFIKPAIHALPIAMGAPFRKLGKILSRTKDRIHMNTDTKVGRAISKGFKGVGKGVSLGAKLVTAPLKLPGKIIGAAGDGLRAYDIKHGDMVGMRQADAVDWLESTGRKVSSALRASSKIGTGAADSLDKDEAEIMRNYLNLMNTTEKQARNNFTEKNNALNKLLTNYKTTDGRKLSDYQVKEILLAAKNKDFGAISHILQKKNLKDSKDGLSEAEFNTLMDGSNGKNGLKQSIMEAAEAETRLYNVKNISKTEAKAKIDTLYERLGISKKDVDLDTKEGRSFLARLFSDRLTELEANPDEIKNKLETDNHDNIESIADILHGIYGIMTGKLQGDDKAINEAIDRTNAKLSMGQNTANKKYKEFMDKAKTTMGKDFEAVKNPAKLTPWKTKLSSRIINIIDGGEGIGNVDILQNIFTNSKILDIQNNFENDAIPVLSDLNSETCRYFIKNITNPSVYNTIENGGYKITKESVYMLADGNSRLVKNCIKIDQIYNKNNDTSIYSKYPTLESIESADINMEAYGISYGSKTSSKWTNLKRKATPIGRGIGRITAKTLGAMFAGDVAGAVLGTAASAILPGTPLPYIAGAGYLGYKGIKGIYDKLNRKGRHYSEYENGGAELPAEEPVVDGQNAYGTIPMHGIGSLLLGAGKSIIGGAGSLVKSLFGKKDGDEKDSTDGKQAGFFASLFGNHSDKPNTAVSSGNFDETDKAGDGKDTVMVDNTPAVVERNSDGSVDFDTSDPNTKNALTKLSLKERALEKLQNAQLKASELIKNTFDTKNVTGSKGGKLGWFSLLLGGALLLKSGVLGTIFNSVVKPIWTDHIKPWVSETAVPWLKNLWGDFKPWLLDTAIPAMGELFGQAIGTLIRELPSIIYNAVKGFFRIGDFGTGNSTNVGAETTVKTSSLSEEYGDDYETAFTDENGDVITASRLKNKDFKKIYNAQGAEGVINEDGTITFEDESMLGSSYIKSVGNASAHAFVKSMYTGKTSAVTRMANKVATKIGKGGFFRKTIGRGIKMLTKPLELAENAGVKLSNKALTKVVGETVENTTETIVEETVQAASKAASKEIIEQTGETVVKETVEKTTKAAAKETAEAAVKTGAKKAGWVASIIAKAKNFIVGLFKNSTVLRKLGDVAESLGVTNVSDWIKNFQKTTTEVIEEAAEKGAKEAGEAACKTVARSLFFWGFIILDFIEGCDTAEAILGVQETSLFEELICGIINAVVNFIPFLAIIPGVNVIARTLYGFFCDDLEERQAEARAAYEKYVAETGSTETLEEMLIADNSFLGKAKKVVGDVWDGIKSVGKGVYNFFTGGGDDSETSDDSEVSSNAAGTLNLPDYLINNNGTSNFITSVIDNVKNSVGDLADKDIVFDHADDIMNKVKDGQLTIFDKEYWELPVESDGTLRSSLENGYSILTRIMNLPLLMVRSSLESFARDALEVSSALTNTNNKAGDKSTEEEDVTIGTRIKDFIVSAIDGIRGLFGFGTGNYKYGTGKYSKQIDPSIAGIRYNASGDSEYQTIGNSGCGPAAAVNALESMYGRGGNAITSAAKFALAHGYKETNGGTKPGFFVDYFNRNGFGAKTSYSKSDIENSINNGLPTVIMGRDARGVSSSTPFGKTPHYVTVTGTDGKGNAIVQDPESRYDDQLYPIKSLIKNTSLGVSAYGKNYRRGRFGHGRWGMGDYSAQIWWGLKQMGMTDAGAAGMMGNLEAESSLQPNNAENAVNTYTGMSDEEYTAAVDSGVIDKQTFLHPKGGESLNGYGLAQWTSIGRKSGLYEFAKSKGVSISNLAMQLEYLGNELANSYKGVYNTLKTTNSLNDASDKVLVDFETPGVVRPIKAGKYNQEQYDLYLKTLNKRRSYGQKYFDIYKGTIGEEIKDITLSSKESNSSNTASVINTNSTSVGSSDSVDYSKYFTSIKSKDEDTDTDTDTDNKEEEEVTLNNLVNKTSEAFMSLFDDSAIGYTFNLLSDKLNSIADNAFYDKDIKNATISHDITNSGISNNLADKYSYVFDNNGSNATSVTATTIPTTSLSNTDYASKMVELAKKELSLGVKEDPLVSDKVKYNDWYWADKPTNERNLAWCGAFVSWIANQAGVPTSIIPKYAWTPTGYDILSNDGKELIDHKSAKPGDILFTYSDADSRINHTGIVTDKSNDQIISIEGNWGNKVSQVKRNIGDETLRITRPKYSGEGGNGIKPLSRYGQFKNSISGNGSMPKNNYISSYNTTTKYNKPSSATNNSGNGTIVYGMGSGPDYSKLITSIISILMTIADNTDKLNLIVSILNNKLNLNISASEVSNATTGKQTLKSKLANALTGFGGGNEGADISSINSIITAMNAIASE